MYNTRPSRTEVRNKERFKWKSKKGGAIIGGISGGGIITLILLSGFLTSWWGLIGGDVITPTVFGLTVDNVYDSSVLDNATITYYDSTPEGIPDDIIATGDADNLTMQSWDFTSGHTYWCLTQLAGFQDKWTELVTNNQNNIHLWELPTINATTVTFLSDVGATMRRNMNKNATITFYFNSTSQEGHGFEPFYNAVTNLTSYVTMNFTFNITTGLTINNVKIKGGVEVDGKKVIDTVAKVLVVPITSTFMCGNSSSTNKFILNLETQGLGAIGLLNVDLVFDGIVYGKKAVSA